MHPPSEYQLKFFGYNTLFLENDRSFFGRRNWKSLKKILKNTYDYPLPVISFLEENIKISEVNPHQKILYSPRATGYKGDE